MNSKALIRDLYSNALTVLNNKQNIIPVKNLNKIKDCNIWQLIRIQITAISGENFKISCLPINFYLDPSDSKACEDILKKLSAYDLVIAGIFGLDQRPNMGFRN